MLLFGALAFGWFAWVIWERPTLVDYFLGREVVERIAGDGFDRNSQWYGWILVYVPTLLLGSLPWSMRLRQAWRGAPATWAHWRATRQNPLPEVETRMFVLLWMSLPLLILCLAHSRLPLYALPLFVPMAIAVAQVSASPLPQRVLAIWVVALLALRLCAVFVPTHKDASLWAQAVRDRAPGPVREVVFVDDMTRYGLHLHLGVEVEVEQVSLRPPTQSAIERGTDHDFVGELSEGEPGLVYVTKDAHYPAVERAARAAGYRIKRRGSPFHGRVFFVADAPPCSPACISEPGQTVAATAP
jgi:hypothetical protein